MSSSCFSEECGLCSACSGDAGTKAVKYLSPPDFYRKDTGKEPPEPQEPENPRVLWQKMMYYSDLYRIHLNNTWGRFVRYLRIRQKSSNMYIGENSIFWEIHKSHVEFIKGCTEEGVIYGEKRCLRPENHMIYSIISRSDVDINKLGGKVVLSGGGLFDIDILKKQMNLTNEDYEKYFDRFKEYIDEVEEKMKEFGVELGDYGGRLRGKIPEFIDVGCEKYTFWDDDRVMCDDPECGLMTHCLINWDEEGNYTGSRPPHLSSYKFGPIIASIPKYTKNKKHELCILCAMKASESVASTQPSNTIQ